MTPSDFLSPDEFGRQVGLSPATVRRYLRAGRIPFAQPGGRRHRVLIPRDALDQFRTPAGIESPGADLAPTVPPRAGPKPRWMQTRPK